MCVVCDSCAKDSWLGPQLLTFLACLILGANEALFVVVPPPTHTHTQSIFGLMSAYLDKTACADLMHRLVLKAEGGKKQTPLGFSYDFCY